MNKVVPVDIGRYTYTNAFFIPDSPDSKQGILVNLNSEENPYVYIKSGKDIPSDFEDNVLASSVYTGGANGDPFMIYDNPDWKDCFIFLRRGDHGDLFNYTNPGALDIYSLSENLANDIGVKYDEEPLIDHNKIVLKKAIVGSEIPAPEVHATPVKYNMGVTWAALTPSEYLRSFAQPFSTFGGQLQQIASHVSGDDIQTTEKKVEQAQYVGAWVDVTVGAVHAFSGTGVVLGVMQSAAGVAADILESKTPDPFDVAGLIFSVIPAGKVSARIGKFSQVGAKGFKYTLKVGETILDLAEVGKSIKTAVETGDPLVIYQALIGTGMSMKGAQDMYDSVKQSSNVEKQEITINSKEDTKTTSNNTDVITAPVKTDKKSGSNPRRFNFGNKDILGRKKGRYFEISLDGGVNWKEGGKVQMLAYALQNAGGVPKLPADKGESNDNVEQRRETDSRDTNGEGQKNKNTGMEGGLNKHLEDGKNPEEYFYGIKNGALYTEVSTFSFFSRSLNGRVRNGTFEVSRDGGLTWKKGWWLQEAVWRIKYRGGERKEILSEDLDKKINKASRKDPAAYSFSCYRAAFNDATQAGVINAKQADWLNNTVTKKDGRGEIMDSQHYRETFGLQSRKPLTTFNSANIRESGFMHVGERRPDGTVHYDHVVYVHVANNEVHLYQANGSEFLLTLNGSDANGKNNNIGEHTSKSHYKHYMNEDRIGLFNKYFENDGNKDGSQPVFVFTPASEVRKKYTERHHSEIVYSGANANGVGSKIGEGRLDSPKVNAETSNNGMSSTVSENNIKKDVMAITRGMPDLENTLAQPSERCEISTKKLSDKLKLTYPNTERVQLLFFRNVDEAATNHFAVRVTIDGNHYISDPTISQFRKGAPDVIGDKEVFVGTESEWLDRMKAAHPNQVIVKSESDTPQTNIRFEDAKGEVLVRPEWVNKQFSVEALLVTGKTWLRTLNIYKNNERFRKAMSSDRLKKAEERTFFSNPPEKVYKGLGLNVMLFKRVSMRTKNKRISSLTSTQTLENMSMKQRDAQIEGLKDMEIALTDELKSIDLNSVQLNYIDDLSLALMDVQIRSAQLKSGLFLSQLAPGEAADIDNDKEEFTGFQRSGRNRRDVNFDETDNVSGGKMDDSLRSQDFSPWRDSLGQSQALKFDDKYSFVGKTVKVIVTDRDGQQREYNFSSNEQSPFKAVESIASDINKTIPDVRLGVDVRGGIYPMRSMYRNIFWVRTGSRLKVSYEITDKLLSNAEMKSTLDSYSNLVGNVYGNIPDYRKQAREILGEEIKRHNKGKPKNERITLDTKITVKVYSKVDLGKSKTSAGVARNNINLDRVKPFKVVKLTVYEVLSGSYKHRIDKITNNKTSEYTVLFGSFEKNPLGRRDKGIRTLRDAVSRDNLEKQLQMNVKKHFENPKNARDISEILGKKIRLAIIKVLIENKYPAARKSLNKFYNGEINAQDLYIKGTRVPGVFAIPLDDKSRIVVNIYTGEIFKIRDAKYTSGYSNRPINHTRYAFVSGKYVKFKSMVMNALPINVQRSVHDYNLSFTEDDTLEFRDGSDIKCLPGVVMNDIKNKLIKDIDTHSYSNTEQNMDLVMNVTHIAVNRLGPLLGTASGGFGFLLALGSEAAFIAARYVQSDMTDNPVESDNIESETLVDTLFLAGGASADTVDNAVKAYRALKNSVNITRKATRKAAKNARIKPGAAEPNIKSNNNSSTQSSLDEAADATTSNTSNTGSSSIDEAGSSVATSPVKTVEYNLDTETRASELLQSIKNNKEIKAAIESPSGTCESILQPTANFMRENGFTDIRYRGMHIWDNGTPDTIPSNHFVVVGRKDGKEYVFDLTAHQFADKGMPNLDGPLILSHDDWVAKYQGATKRKRITYSDYNTPSTARHEYSALPGAHSVTEIKPNEVALTTPSWYETALKAKSSPLSQAKDAKIRKSGKQPYSVSNETRTVLDQSNTYTYRNYKKFQLWMPDNQDVIPNKVMVSAHGSSTGKTVAAQKNTEIYFYSKHGELLDDRGLTSHNNNPLARVSYEKTEVPDGKGGWRPATEGEMKELTGTTEPGKYKDMDLSHYEHDNPPGAIDTWRLEDSQVSSPSRRPGIVTIQPSVQSTELSKIADSVSGPTSVTQIHVLACRGTRWTAWRNALMGNSSQGARAAPVLPNRFSNVFSANSGRNYTASRPPTDAIGNIGIHAANNMSQPAKAGAAVTGATVLAGAAGYAGYRDLTDSQYRAALADTIRNTANLRDKLASTTPEVQAKMSVVQEHFFGKGNSLSEKELDDVLTYLKNLQKQATKEELRLIYSGTMPERLQKICPMPNVFNRISIGQFDLFGMFIDTMHKDPERFNTEYNQMANHTFKNSTASKA
ncbi:putative adhesin [Serratia bockelmannii]|uniref:putative adhesin n=1 Tax=Serratia bockelmannii TaxID=2703793 RepID=UPI003FA75D71